MFVFEPVLRAQLSRYFASEEFKRKLQQNVESIGNKSLYLFLEASNAVAQYATPPSVTHHISAVV